MKGIEGKIKKLRNEKGLSKADMSRACDITATAYSNIEDDLTDSINIETGKKIAKAFGIGFNELFEIEIENQQTEQLKNEIEQLKKRIQEYEDQLFDKKRLVEFLYSNDLLLDLAYGIERKKKDLSVLYRSRDFYDLDSLIVEIKDRPYDRENRESLINYVLENMNWDGLKKNKH